MTQSGLVRYDAMCLAITECHGVDEAKDIRDKARAIEVYAQQAKNTDAERKAAEIRIRAERRAGELLIEMKEAGERVDKKSNLIPGGKTSNSCVSSSREMPKPPAPAAQTLKDLGITYDQSSKWQKLANMPADEFEKAVKGDGPKPTTDGILNASMAVHYSSESEEWYTPPEIIERVQRVFVIELDPCSNAGELAVPASRRFTKAEDGLSQSWAGCVYMNPPYGREIQPWVAKLVAEYGEGEVSEAIALVPARVDTNWFRLFRDCAICFIDGRLKFSGHENSAPFPSAVVYLGKDIDKFSGAFEDMGDVWVRWSREGHAIQP